MARQSPETVLHQVFGFKNFRQGQAEAVKALVDGESACVVFPTGAGKSICYQLPGILFEKLTIVVCPLIALMKDQVEFLQSKKVKAEFFNCTLDKDQSTDFFDRLKTGQIQILYVSPERFRNERFMKNMVNVEVELLAIDESHCISEWGHAFRPDYLLLKKAAIQLKAKRILCCTATATPKVAEDIIKSFNIPSKNLIRTSFFRSNLHLRFTAVSEESKKSAILASLSKDLQDGSIYCGSGIVYVTTHKQAMVYSNILKGNGFHARPYHAGMPNDERESVQD